MSITNLSTKADGEAWGTDGRAAFTQIKTYAVGRFLCTSQTQARPDWPGPLDWVCTYPDPELNHPTNLGELDEIIDASGA